MTFGEVLALIAVVLIALGLWVARQARIVCDEVRARTLAMEAEDQADGQKSRSESCQWRGRPRQRRC
jgi:hypothetical protein